jgi:hypothetical protein
VFHLNIADRRLQGAAPVHQARLPIDETLEVSIPPVCVFPTMTYETLEVSIPPVCGFPLMTSRAACGSYVGAVRILCGSGGYHVPASGLVPSGTFSRMPP